MRWFIWDPRLFSITFRDGYFRYLTGQYLLRMVCRIVFKSEQTFRAGLEEIQQKPVYNIYFGGMNIHLPAIFRTRVSGTSYTCPRLSLDPFGPVLVAYSKDIHRTRSLVGGSSHSEQYYCSQIIIPGRMVSNTFQTCYQQTKSSLVICSININSYPLVN